MKKLFTEHTESWKSLPKVDRFLMYVFIEYDFETLITKSLNKLNTAQ